MQQQKQKLALVIDDHRDVRELMSTLLLNAGFRVVLAKDGVDGYDKLSRTERPDVVVLDLMMPRMSGWELIEALRATPGTRRLPVVAVSALEFTGPQRRQFDAYVPKLHLSERLVPVVEAVLHRGT